MRIYALTVALVRFRRSIRVCFVNANEASWDYDASKIFVIRRRSLVLAFNQSAVITMIQSAKSASRFIMEVAMVIKFNLYSSHQLYKKLIFFRLKVMKTILPVLIRAI